MTDFPIDPAAPSLGFVVNPANGQGMATGGNTPQPGFPDVQGRCPACGGSSLFLGSGGYLTCARLDCPQPDAATEVIADFWDARQHNAFTFCSQSVGHVTMTEFAKKISEKRTALAQRDEAAEYANEQKRRADSAQAVIDRLLAFCNDIDSDHDWRPPGPEIASRIRALIAGEAQ